MTDSKLATKDYPVKNYTPMSDKQINKVTIHHQAGNLTLEQIRNMFNGSRQASSNYAIDTNGNISQMVREKDRSWCSSSSWNDGQAVTIEVANCKGAPNWEVSDKAFNALIELCADICRRNNIYPIYDGTKNGTFTEHNMFVATACPGPYLHKKMPEIIQLVRAKLNDKPVDPVKPNVIYRVQIGAFKNKANATKCCNKAKKTYADAFVTEKQGGYYKVQIGAFAVYDNAVKQQQSAVKLGYKDAFIVKVVK